jgi:hypothetical protein
MARTNRGSKVIPLLALLLLLTACETAGVGGNGGGSRFDVGEGEESCEPSYPDSCILPPPPDLDCDDVSEQNFRVVGSDPHRFDGDGDGFGCEPYP